MFNVDKFKLRVYFKHYPLQAGEIPYPYVDKVGSMLQYRGKSECYIIDNTVPEGEPQVIEGIGEAYCGLKDNFSRKTGRKVSFTRAVMGMENKEIRKALWEEFRKVGGV